MTYTVPAPPAPPVPPTTPAEPPAPAPERWPAVARRVAPLLEGALAAGALVAASLPWRHAYQLAGTVPLLVAAAVAPVLITLAVARWGRRGPLWSYGLSLIGLFALLMVALAGDAGGIWSGLGQGLSRLLSSTPPLAGPRWVLVVPLVVTWVAAAATGELLVRLRNPGPALAVVVAHFVLAVAASSAVPGDPRTEGIVVVTLVALVAAVRQSPWAGVERAATVARRDDPTADRSRSARAAARRVGAGVIAAGVLAAGLAAAVPSLPGLRHATTSPARRPPVSQIQATTPLDAIAQLRDGTPKAPPVPLFTVTTSGPWTGYVALATFDTYDGAEWSFDRTYLPTGGRVPDPPADYPAAVGAVLRQSYTVTTELPAALPFVPFVNHPVTVSGVAVDADGPSGTVVPLHPVTPRSSYTVTSRVPADTLGGLSPSARIGSAGGGLGIALPAAVGTDLQPTLRYLQTLTGEAPTPTVAFLQRLATVLATRDKRLLPTHTSGSGTSLAEVVSAISISHAATPEQFATLFVTVARSLGVPARLVTGFKVTDARSGKTTVTDRDAWTWAEVPIVGEGWVVVDPSPASTTKTRLPSGKVEGSSTPTTTAPPQNVLPGPGGSHAVGSPVHINVPHAHHLGPWAVVLLVAAAIVAAVAAAFAGAAAWRALRRSRRRRAPPPLAAAGAWLDVLDALERAGADPGPAATTTEVARVAGDTFGPDLVPPLRSVAVVAERALFLPTSPPSDADAAGAWRAAVTFGRTLRRRLPVPERLRGALRIGRRARG